MRYKNKINLIFTLLMLFTAIILASFFYFLYSKSLNHHKDHLKWTAKENLFHINKNQGLRKKLFLKNQTNSQKFKSYFFIVRKNSFPLQNEDKLSNSEKKIAEYLELLIHNNTKGQESSQISVNHMGNDSIIEMYKKNDYISFAIMELAYLKKPYYIAFSYSMLFFFILFSLQYLFLIRFNKNIDNQVQLEQYKFNDTFEQAAVGITHLSLDGKWIFVNQKFCDILGYTKDELLNRSFKDFTHPKDIDRDNKNLNKVLSKQLSHYSVDKRYIKKDASIVWVKLTLSLGKSTLNKRSYFISVVEDISSAKLDQYKLIEEKERSQNYLDLAAVFMLALDKDWKITMINKKGCQILEYEDEELIGKDFYDIVIPLVYREETKRKLENYVGTGRTQIDKLELNAITKSGVKKLLSWDIIYFYNNDNAFQGILASGEDITGKKQIESTLRLAGKVFDNTNEAIVITDPEGIILDVNPSFEKITGYLRTEVIGQNPRILKSGKHNSEFYKKMWNSILNNGSWQGEIFDQRKNGEIYPKWMSINTIKDENGNISNFISTFSDISQSKQNEEFFQYLAYYDTLTELPNRMLFHDRLQQGLTQADRDKQMLALMFLDLDRFKNVNDTLGHQAGDQLLILVAKRLKQCVYETDTVARLGGDEFTIILRNIGDESTHKVTLVAKRIIHAFSKPFYIEDQELFMTTSIGITLFPGDGESLDELVKNADIAMYHAKSIGKNTYQFFSNDMNIKNFELMDMEVNLRRALERDEFHIQYQPLVDLTNNKIIGAEALLRWKPSKSGMISPDKFIPLAEETGLIIPIGQWVIKSVINNIIKWKNMGVDPLKISINISTIQFKQSNFVKDWLTLFEEYDLNFSKIELELTESILMQDIDEGISIINELKELGLNIAIDDFGTGYSSLNYLKKLPIDTLKIDQSFIRDLNTNKSGSTIVDAIIAMGHSMDMKVVAEGVENKNHVDFLKSHYCDQAQGYYFSKPMNEEDFLKIIKKGRILQK